MEENTFALPEYTPDLFLLQQAENQLVFDVGPFHRDKPYIGTAYSLEKMTMVKQHDRHAILLRMPYFPKFRVQGTLYLMNAEQIMELDTDRKNGLVFERKQAPVVLPQTDSDGEYVTSRAWIYRGVPDYWSPQILWDAQTLRCGKYKRQTEFDFAPVYESNERFFHNHYSFNGIPIEASDALPWAESTQITEEVLKVIQARNELEIRILHERKKKLNWFNKNKVTQTVKYLRMRYPNNKMSDKGCLP